SVFEGRTRNLRALVASRPDVARLLGLEDLLGTWAVLAERRQTPLAARVLALARELGNELASAHGDRMLADAVASIDRWRGASPDRPAMRTLVTGHILFRRGVAAERRELYTEAAQSFDQARLRFTEAATPFARMADLHLAVCRYYQRRYPESLQ